jgi:hypothetical protein
MENARVEIPKRKQNFFFVYDRLNNKYNEVKYLSQTELSDGYRQITPKNKIKKLINHFSITLCFLPEYLWCKLKKETKNNEETYKPIKDGITVYSIVETNQDDVMIGLFKELSKVAPDKLVLNCYINELDDTQYNSWLVLRAKNYINYNYKVKPNEITEFNDIPKHYLK